MAKRKNDGKIIKCEYVKGSRHKDGKYQKGYIRCYKRPILR